MNVELLLDTHVLLWWLSDDERLSKRARAALQSAKNERFVSIATAWELAIKVSLGRLKLPTAVGRFLADQLPSNAMSLLALSLYDVDLVERLPFHHRDPFDRLMAAQALERNLVMVSIDPIFEQYGVDRIW
ncbi:MAG TPA: type II toxin-antitoxin system VapC family toxin [Vicinamibacterales bacterium]|nr:type II toxin-antitoxin system VapC family toxin [Vicinamibacterales bacterium]